METKIRKEKQKVKKGERMQGAKKKVTSDFFQCSGVQNSYNLSFLISKRYKPFL